MSEQENPKDQSSGKFFPLSATTLQMLEWVAQQRNLRQAPGAVGIRSLFYFMIGWARVHDVALKGFVQQQFSTLDISPTAVAFEALLPIGSRPPNSGIPYMAQDGMEVLTHSADLIKTLRRTEIEPHHIMASILIMEGDGQQPAGSIGLPGERVRELRRAFLQHVKEGTYGEAWDYWTRAFSEVDSKTPRTDNNQRANAATASDAEKPKTDSPGQSGTLFKPRREADKDELCLNIGAYAQAIADTFTAAGHEDDFIFALYGPWGRGKSTLIKEVSKILECDSKKQRPRYKPIVFSSWKYPSRPEVWVHLYEKIALAAQEDGFWQKFRIGFRIGLLRHGWWPLIGGLGLLALSRLLFEFAHWFFNGVGLVGLLIVGSFIWSASKTGKKFRQSYFSMPNHADKLGLQAVIGQDLNDLLSVWISPRTPPNAKQHDRTAVYDFSKWWPARCGRFSVVILIWATLGLVSWKLHRYAPAQDKPPVPIVAPRSEATASPSEPLQFLVEVEGKSGKLRWTGSNNLPLPEKTQHAPISRWPLIHADCLLVLGALAAWFIASRTTQIPEQQERLLLVVDDLDRCEPEQMLAVVESLRLFLDEADMSHRMQVAMLMDKEVLGRALVTRSEKSGRVFNGDGAGRFAREQREKFFVAELTLPNLSHDEINDLATAVVDKEYRNQLNQKLEEAKRTLTLSSPIGQTHVVEGRTPVTHRFARGFEMEFGGDPITKTVQLEPTKEEVVAHAERQKAAKQAQADLLQELQSVSPQSVRASGNRTRKTIGEVDTAFSDEERKSLKSVLVLYADQKITPRALRAFVFRYQLARLLLQHLGIRPKPEHLVTALAVSLFGDRPGALVNVSPELNWAVRHVI